jgi:hypothetical protein
MKPTIIRFCLLAFLGFAFARHSFAQTGGVPNFMNYQAYVTDQNNQPLGNATPTNYTAIFRIYDQASGGTILWAEQQTVTIFQGNFSVILGNGQVDGANPKPPFSEVFDQAERYLGITVNTGSAPTEFTPRQRILANAYAQRAALAEVALSARTVEGDDLNVDSSGRVGVGTSSPIAPLTIAQSSVASKGQITLIDPSNPSTSNSATNAITAFGSNYGNGATGRIWYMGSASASNKDLAIINDLAGNITLGTNGRSSDLVINTAGGVSVTGDLAVSGSMNGDVGVDSGSPTSNLAPNAYSGEVSFDLKNRSAVGVPGMGTQTAVMTLSPGSGADHQIAVNEGGLFWRQGPENGTSWSSWARISADTFLPAGRQRTLWSNSTGGTHTPNISSHLNAAGVPTWATGVILKVIVSSNNGTTRYALTSSSPFASTSSFRLPGSGSLIFSDASGAFSSNVHYQQNGFTNYNSGWSGGVVKADLLDEGDGIRRYRLRYRHSSNSSATDSSVSSYATLIGYY